jgi:hypothetical protein
MSDWMAYTALALWFTWSCVLDVLDARASRN